MKPYVPGHHADPSSFAGKVAMLSTVREITGDALQIRRSSALLLHAYRGSGKSSAICKIESMMRDAVPGA